jgi:hypothetical protein
MLDRSKVASVLKIVAPDLFIDNGFAFQSARDAWSSVCSDPTFFYKTLAVKNAPWPIPHWTDPLDLVVQIDPYEKPYTIFGVDGSQIYPDRHLGYHCFLINIGGIIIRYGTQNILPTVEFISDPFIFPLFDWNGSSLSNDFVNAKRHELELDSGFFIGKKLIQESFPCAVFFDGSLIFWHLESQKGLKDQFLSKYLNCLCQCKEEEIPFIGYISAPKSKELVNLIRLFLSHFDPEKVDTYAHINIINDAHVVSFFVPPFHRTTIFENKSSIASYYPKAVAPYFFYINTEYEVARVELPAWIAQNEKSVNLIAALILDQVNKGMGYPLVIAESHQQAVVKRDDREFFYALLERTASFYGKNVGTASLKLQKKLRMSI